MHLRRVARDGKSCIEVSSKNGWVSLASALHQAIPNVAPGDAARWSTDLVAFLGAPPDVRACVAQAAQHIAPENDAPTLMPFEPRSFRDFMLYERHAIDAARGFVRAFMPRLFPVTRLYEAVTGGEFPRFRPKPLWYRTPVYYMGNHLSFVTDGAEIARPAYTRALDYELELGFVLAHGLFNANPEEAEQAIGGFVVLNDFSARDIQLDEMGSGFGPQKAKHFANAISSVVATADEILPRWQSLTGAVRINGSLIAEPTSANPRWSLGEVLAYASRAERLYPGELFGTGTLPGGSGIETGRLLEPGDVIELSIGGIGTLTNTIIAEQEPLS